MTIFLDTHADFLNCSRTLSNLRQLFLDCTCTFSIRAHLVQSPLQKKGGGKRGFVEVCGNLKGYFSEQWATHVLNHEWAHMHDGWRVV